MAEETTRNKKRMLENVAFSQESFGPEQIVQMNEGLPESTITLFLPPDFDKRLLPTKARALRNWWEVDDKTRMHARFCLPLTMASGLGYYILSPATFTVEWDGDPAHDTEVTIIDGASHAQIDNHSSFGSFTVQARFIARTKNVGDFIYVKGVANQYRQPFSVMEAMIESWWSPSEFGVVSLVNQPGKFTVKKGEPLAQMFVVSSNSAQYGLAIAEGYPPFWEEWSEKRKPEVYDGRNMDYLRGLLPDQTPVCPHFKAWSAEGHVDEIKVDLSVKQCWAAGDAAKDANNMDEAIRQYYRALQLAEDREEVTEQLLYALRALGREIQEKQNYDLSIRLLQKCIAMNERYFAPGLEFTADLLTEIAYSYRMSGDLDSAAKHLTESLKRKRTESKPVSLARTLIDLGTLHDFRGRRDEAAPLLKEARVIYDACLPANDPQNLYLKNVYACLLTHQGQYEEASKLYDDVIRERTIIFGADSLEVAFTYNDLGFHFKSMQLYDEAEKQFMKCLVIRQHKLGNDDLEVAQAHEDLAWLFRESGRPDKAKKQLEQVLAIRKVKLVPTDPLLRRTYLALRDVYNDLGEKDLAEQARKIAEHK